MKLTKEQLTEKFRGSQYIFGFKLSNGGGLAFGQGWSMWVTRYILVCDNTVKYSRATVFPGDPTIEKTVAYTEDFYIPKGNKEFDDFLNG